MVVTMVVSVGFRPLGSALPAEVASGAKGRDQRVEARCKFVV